MSSTVIAPTEKPSRTLQIGSLVAAPLVAILARLLWTPFEEDDSGAYLSDVGEHAGRSEAGALLMILSAILLVPAAFALAGVVRARRPLLARISTALIVTGAVGMAAMCTIGIVAAEMSRQPDRAAMVQAWDAIFTESEAGEVIFLAVCLGVIGFMVMAVGLYRSGGTSLPAAVLAGLGGAAVLFTSGGPERPLLVAAAVVALIGFVWAGTVARR